MEKGKTQGVHDLVHNLGFSSELQQIIEAWPELPEHIKAAIMALIKTA
jgi:hypothetical protein